MKVDYTLVNDSPEELKKVFDAHSLGWLKEHCTTEDHQDSESLITIRPTSHSLFARVYCAFCGEFQRKVNL